MTLMMIIGAPIIVISAVAAAVWGSAVANGPLPTSRMQILDYSNLLCVNILC
jgi:hypothetical protein